MSSLALETLQGLTARSLWLSLLHSLWFGMVIAAIVASVLRSRRSTSHNARHHLLIVALAMVSAGPFAITGLQATSRYFFQGRLARKSSSTIVVESGVSSPLPTIKTLARKSLQTELHVKPTSWIALSSHELSRMARILRSAQPWGLIVWGVVLGGLGLFLALGARAIGRLHREARPAPDWIRKQSLSLVRRLQLRRAPEVRIHPTVGEPCLCGLLQPFILLPERWINVCSDELLEAVLAHELAHARRSDHLVNLFQRLLEIVFFYHPAIHWISGSLRRQREYCADALAVRVTKNPLALARALESVARLRQGAASPFPLGMTLAGEKSSLLSRIQELVGMTPSLPKHSLWPFATLPLAATIALAVIPIGWAQDQAAPSQPMPEVQTITARGSIKAEPKPVSTRGDLDNDRQVTLELRFISLGSEHWRDLSKDHPRVAQKDAPLGAWILDQKSVRQLLVQVQSRLDVNVLQAPKVTTFEHAPAIITTGTALFRSRLFTREQSTSLTNPNSAEARQFLKDLTNEITVTVKGAWLDEGLRLSTSVDYAAIPPRFASARTPENSDRRAGDPQRFSIARHRNDLTCDVPPESSLLISLGAYDEKLIAPPQNGQPSERERLVLITPWKIDFPRTNTNHLP